MTHTDKAQAMIAFLRTRVLRNAPTEILEDTPLVSSGLVDSFALIEVLLQLEKVTGRKISASAVRPSDLDTVAEMLCTAERIGVAH